MDQNFDYSTSDEKLLLDAFGVRVIGGIQHLAIQSGKSIRCYVFPLAVAKALSRALGKSVQEIEEKTGQKFDTPLDNEPRLSPLNMQDPPDEDKKK